MTRWPRRRILRAAVRSARTGVVLGILLVGVALAVTLGLLLPHRSAPPGRGPASSATTTTPSGNASAPPSSAAQSTVSAPPSSASSTASQAAPPPVAAPATPSPTLALTDAQEGQTFTLPMGTVVSFSVRSDGRNRWGPPRAQDETILAPMASTADSDGNASGRFRASRRGTTYVQMFPANGCPTPASGGTPIPCMLGKLVWRFVVS